MSIDVTALAASAVYSGITLYMLLVLTRWLGPFLELDFYDARLRWIARGVDPLLRAVRRALPPVGPIDAGPPVAILLLWIARTIAVGPLV